MKKIILTFGLISGAISSLMMIGTEPFQHRIPYDKALIIGYSTMVLSFLVVFFGMRSYRDNAAGGRITFGKAFGIGIAITLISCLCYVVTWEIIYFNFMHNFMDDYTAHAMAKVKASGANPAAIQQQLQQLKKSRELYENPFYNAALTFAEPFPVGLVITLISALIVRRKVPAVASSAVTASS
jgi:hypothetical protein